MNFPSAPSSNAQEPLSSSGIFLAFFTKQQQFLFACISTKTYSRSIQMNFPVNVLPSESVVLISFPRKNDLVNSKDDFRRSLTEASGAGDGGDCDSSVFVSAAVMVAFFESK